MEKVFTDIKYSIFTMSSDKTMYSPIVFGDILRLLWYKSSDISAEGNVEELKSLGCTNVDHVFGNPVFKVSGIVLFDSLIDAKYVAESLAKNNSNFFGSSGNKVVVLKIPNSIGSSEHFPINLTVNGKLEDFIVAKFSL
jgi:hypothetical protein